MDDDDTKRHNKPKKEKTKKTTVEPALLLGQNTNVFSQLSANYLQGKAQISEEEKAFIQNTEIIEYHDPNINRMIGLLRKKAEVTKGKAVNELKEYVKTMDADQVEAFMSTFGYLFKEEVLSEDSKQVLDEMCSILSYFLENHKKLVIPNIAGIYPAMLIAQKITAHKFLPLLFGGDASLHPEKSVILLLKPQVAKQFMILATIVVDNDDVSKLSQPVFVRNCYGLGKAFKDMIGWYNGLGNDQKVKLAEPWAELYGKFARLSQSGGAKKYLKQDSKAKASFLQLSLEFLQVETGDNKIPTQVNPRYWVDNIMDNYLTKDIAVQTALWKYCNTPLIPILSKMGLENLLSKYDTKLFEALKVGGAPMLRSLPNYVKVFPFTTFHSKNTNELMNTINYIRKLNQALLDLDEQNELRMQAYGDINLYFIEQYQKLRKDFPSDTQDEKENKRRDQLGRLSDKAEKQTAQSLEERYYKSPPVSRNSMNFYIPAQFERLIRNIEGLPNMRFVPPHTYTLYKSVAGQPKFQPLVDNIFSGLKTTQQTLQYFENFPAREVKVPMSGGQLREIYQRCRIFHLTIQFQQFEWFKWQHYYNLFMFDPLLEPHHIQEIADKAKPTFNQKLFPKGKQDKYDSQKINFALQMLKSRQSKLRFFLPSLIQLLKRQAKVDWKPFIDIFSADMQQLASGPNVQVIRNVQCMYQLVLGYLADRNNQDEHLNTFMSRYFELVFFTDENRMSDVALNLIDRAKELRGHPQFGLLLESLKNCVAKRVLTLTKAGANLQQRKQRNLKAKTASTLQLFRVLNQFIAFVCAKKLVSEICQELLLPIYLQYALFRVEAWQLLHIFLEELSDEQRGALLTTALAKNNFVCLSMLSSVSYVYPLQNYLELKRFYVQMCSTLLKPMILDQLQAQNSNTLTFLKSLADNSVEESLIFSAGLRSIIKQLVLQCGDNEILETILQVCVKELVERLFVEEQPAKAMRISITVKNVLPEFRDMLAEKSARPLLDQSLAVINQILDSKGLAEDLGRVRLEAALDIVSTFWVQGVCTELLFDQKAFPLSRVIEQLMEAMAERMVNLNFQMQVLLNFANAVIEKRTLQPFSDQLVRLENMVMRLMDFNFKTAGQHNQQTKFSGDSLVKLCQFLRKVLPVSEAFRSQFKPLVVQNVLLLSNAKAQDYKIAADDVDSGVVDDNVQAIVVEFSELIARFALNVTADLDEELVLALLGCVFPQLQKSAFILLRQYYELGFAKGPAPAAFMTRLQTKVDHESTALVFSQLLTWSALFLRELSQEKARKEDSEDIAEGIQSSKLPDAYLAFVFGTIESLDYEENLPELTPQQVWEVAADWSSFLNKQQVLKLAVQSLFIFADSFPMSLRLWVSGLKDRRTKGLCEKVVKELISEALFLKQVEKIELRQPEWKSQHFQVFAAKRSRQISAQYKKQNASVSLKLKVKPDYPLSPIGIEFANQLKIGPKLDKWAVRLRSLLYNQNNSIASAILIWKQNIDKQFQGIEQCAICYDIVNAAKQLPRMVCKTCKKKFHAACIRKWFTTSNKSECPLCKSQFL